MGGCPSAPCPAPYWFVGPLDGQLATAEVLERLACRVDRHQLGPVACLRTHARHRVERFGSSNGWLTSCDADEYPQTRAWSRWLRERSDDAQGAVWLSKRDPGETVMVLWEDRCPTDVLVSAPGPLPGPCRFDEPDGLDWLRDALAGYRVTIRR